MEIIGEKLSLEDFEEYVDKKDFGTLPPTFFVIHHTWKPTKYDWNGDVSIKGLKKYYEKLGWSAGPHLFIEDGGIWLFTDMYDVGIHAGAGNGTLQGGYSIGIEAVGDYDNEKWSGGTKSNMLGAIRSLQKKLDIPDDKIKFHRDYSSKTCPGSSITKEWLLNELIIKEIEMDGYHITSDLEKELQKRDEDFDGDKKSDQKDMAETLKNERHALEDFEDEKVVAEFGDYIIIKKK